MRNCERCAGEVSWTNDVTSLTCGYHAHLCTACERDLIDLFLDSDAGKAMDVVAARHEHYVSLARAGRPVSFDDWQAQVAAKSDADRMACALVRQFLAFPITAERRGD